ncbi:N-acetyltransferase [Desulfonatronovibrio hydrogenovorans]|uniref:N-acetyltransferase n=1 Tax=Desulfonatronovibrio hydrogenovorans TaxID=53245 RepID=UPI00048AA41D|nr:N-acetyltransferase [Desulfonatronovibrio hydrogenovorans]
MDKYFLRKARISDVKSIHTILMDCSKQGLLLPRSYSDLYGHLRDYYVIARDHGPDVLGCCALSIVWESLAEIRSLAIVSELRGMGWGRKLVESCLSEAITLGIYKVFTLTYQSAFFSRLGFVEISKDVLPQKVWADCLRCPKFPDCDETAMLMEM